MRGLIGNTIKRINALFRNQIAPMQMHDGAILIDSRIEAKINDWTTFDRTIKLVLDKLSNTLTDIPYSIHCQEDE